MNEILNAKIKAGNDAANEAAIKAGYLHYAFVFCKKTAPQRKRIRHRSEPWKVDTRFFIRTNIMPFPEWDTIADAQAWIGKLNGGGIFKTWTCAKCSKIHVLCYPLELTGGSSGKNVRKVGFFKTHDPEKFEQELLKTKYNA